MLQAPFGLERHGINTTGKQAVIPVADARQDLRKVATLAILVIVTRPIDFGSSTGARPQLAVKNGRS